MATVSDRPHLVEATRQLTATIDRLHATMGIVSDRQAHLAAMMIILLQETTVAGLHHRETHMDRHQEIPIATHTVTLCHQEHTHQSRTHPITPVREAHRAPITTTVEATAEDIQIVGTNGENQVQMYKEIKLAPGISRRATCTSPGPSVRQGVKWFLRTQKRPFDLLHQQATS